MVPSSLFILASSVCKSLQCLISPLTHEGKGGHLFRLTCSVVLWEGRNTANKYHWHVWGVLCYGPHWVCPSSWRHVLSWSTLLRLCRRTVQSRPCISYTSQVLDAQVQVLRYSTKAQSWLGLRFVLVPGPSSSGDQVFGEHGCLQLKAATYSLPRPSCSVFWVYNKCVFSGVPCVSSREHISGCDPPSRCRLSRIARSLG